MDFKDIYINLSGKAYPSLDAAWAEGAPTINYGMFLNTVLDFIIVAVIIFLMIHMISRVKRPLSKTMEPTTRDCPCCMMAISISWS